MALRWVTPGRLALLAAAALVWGAQPAAGQVVHEVHQLEGVGIDEHPDALLPLDANFKDELGRDVKLGDYFDGKHPVILNLAYYSCPMLCSLTIGGMVTGLSPLPWSPGVDFNIVTLSFDPLETPALAKVKQQNYIHMYGRPSAAAGWHFLTGERNEIDRVTEAVGFHYKWDPQQKEYAHPSVIFIITPDGRISRYLYGIEFEPKTLKLALLEASKGKIGSTTDRIMLYCYHYDATAGRYAPVALNIMRLSGVATVALLLAVILPLFALERRRHRAAFKGAK